MSGAPPLPILPDQLRHSVKLGAALEQHHHLLVISVHAVALVGCAASLCVGIERLRGRLAGGIDEFSPMTQSTDPGLLSNIAFTLGNFQAWSAVYGRDVLALQLVSLICLFSLGWMPLIAVERWWATRPADGASARRRWALRA